MVVKLVMQDALLDTKEAQKEKLGKINKLSVYLVTLKQTKIVKKSLKLLIAQEDINLIQALKNVKNAKILTVAHVVQIIKFVKSANMDFISHHLENAKGVP